MPEKPTVFISYNWGSDIAATFLERSLDGIADVKRDKKNIKPWGDIKAFMKSIREQDLAVLILSESYLKSGNCMFELLELMQKENWDHQVMFVVEDSAKGIYDTGKQLEFIKYWCDEEEKLAKEIQGLDPRVVKKQKEELEKRHLISLTIGEFMERVQYMNNPKPVEAIDEIVERVKNYNGINNDDKDVDQKDKRGKSVEERVEEFLSQYKYMTLSEITEALGTPRMRTKIAVRTLVDEGTIETTGSLSERNTRYKLAEKKPEADLSIGPRFNVIFRGHSTALSNLHVKITNVSDYIVSQMKNEVVSVILADGSELEIPSSPDVINHHVLDRMGYVEFSLNNDGFGRYQNGKYTEEYENYDLIWTFRCCDADGNKYVYEVKKHVDKNRMNASEINDGITCTRIA